MVVLAHKDQARETTDPEPGIGPATPFLTRVRLRQYKSIAACDVELGSLCFLVGPNGSGKSNFLDALRFVADSLRYSLDHAIRDRDGIQEIRRRFGLLATHVEIRLDFRLATGPGHYAFDIFAGKGGAYSVKREECRIVAPSGEEAYYCVEDGDVKQTTFLPAPAAVNDRLYLVSVSGLESFRPLFDSLSGMGFYNLDPRVIRAPQAPDPGNFLLRDGRNLTSVVASLSVRAPELKERIEQYLAQVVPGLSGFEVIRGETLEFHQAVGETARSVRFNAASMSDGTLRALGILVALFHRAANDGRACHLIGIEEPELALHPAAAGVLIDSLRDAQQLAQVLVTSHSPDLLDDQTIPDEAIRVVVADHGETRIGRLDEASRSALREHLYTAGELLRMDQLYPDPQSSRVDPGKLQIFGPGPPSSPE